MRRKALGLTLVCFAACNGRNGTGHDPSVRPGDMAFARGDLGSANQDLAGSGGGDLAATGSGGQHQIAFHSTRALDGSDAAGSPGAYNIWVANDDGTGLAPLTTNNGVNMFPQYSPDGARILFVSDRGGDGGAMTQNLWVMNADGGGQTPLTSLSHAVCLQASWSPDGTRIVYVSDRALDGSDATMNANAYNVWVINADGTGSTPLTQVTTTQNVTPVFSPDSARVAYVAAGDNIDPHSTTVNSNVHVVGADGHGDVALSLYASVTAAGPTWSPDSREIAFNSDGTLDGKDVVLYRASGDNVYNIWIADVSAGTLTPVTSSVSDGDNNGELWSAANRVFFYSANDIAAGNVVGDLWIMNGDGTNKSPLLRAADMSVWRGLQLDSRPAAWSRDGSALAFTFKASVNGGATPSGSENVWVVNADGSGLHAVTRLTATGADCLSPSWRP